MLASRPIGVRIAVMVIVALATVPGFAADEPPKPAEQSHGPLYLGGIRAPILRRETVIKDLGLTDDQTAAVNKIADDTKQLIADLRVSMKDAPIRDQVRKEVAAEREAARKIDAVLNEKQAARLNEIILQKNGLSSIQDPAIAGALDVTLEQRAKLRRLFLDRSRAMSAAIKDAGGDRKAAHPKIMQIDKDSNEKMLAILTPEQRAKFEQMQGKKIDLGDPSPLGGLSPRSADPDSKHEINQGSKHA